MRLTSKILIGFYFLIASHGTTAKSNAQSCGLPIVITKNTKQVSLLNNSCFAISRKNNKTIRQLDKLKWKNLDSSLRKPMDYADTVKQVWIRFSTQNLLGKDSLLAIKMGGKNQETTLYEELDGRLYLRGKTGYGARLSDQSVKGDYLRIYLSLHQKETQKFYLLINKYQYNISKQWPVIETLDVAYHERVTELVVNPSSYRNLKLWVAGFYFAVFIYCSLKFWLQSRDRSYLYYALASISLFFRYSLQVDALNFETDYLPWLNNDFIFLLSFIPQSIFYILFLNSFLQVRRNKFLFWYLIFCISQWLMMIIVMPVHFIWPERSGIAKLLWVYNSLPFLVLVLLLSYFTRPKPNQSYLKFAFIGLLTLSFSFIFVLIPRWLNILDYMPEWYNNLNNHLDLITLAFVIDTILFLTALAFRDRLNEVERMHLQVKNAENERKILRLQMNPHFIFNCLNSINLYIEQNNSELAGNYLSKFSRLMRMSLAQTRKDKISLSEEIKMLKLYLDLETMRFKGKLKYHLNIEEDLDMEFIEIPPMLIQPHLENAIWHGLMHKKDGGTIIIDITQDLADQALIVKIEDNGIGRARAAELHSKEVVQDKSYGTLITEERIASFNKKFKAETTLDIHDIFDAKGNPSGTLVILNIHLI